jgi:transposase
MGVRPYYDRKVKEGKTNKEALRCLKRRISDAIFAHLVADANRKAEAAKAGPGPGGQTGNGSVSSVAGSHPERQLFGQATPRPASTMRPTPTTRGPKAQESVRKKSRKAS